MERGRGVLEVSDKMPSWGEFYQSLENPPWKGFVWNRALSWWQNLCRPDIGAIRAPVFSGRARVWGSLWPGPGCIWKATVEKSQSEARYGDTAATPRHAPLPSLQSPTAANHYVAAHNIHKLGFPKNIFWGTFIMLLLYCYQRDKILQVRPTERKENFDRAQNILTFSDVGSAFVLLTDHYIFHLTDLNYLRLHNVSDHLDQDISQKWPQSLQNNVYRPICCFRSRTRSTNCRK